MGSSVSNTALEKNVSELWSGEAQEIHQEFSIGQSEKLRDIETQL
jgi:hypothetical protein